MKCVTIYDHFMLLFRSILLRELYWIEWKTFEISLEWIVIVLWTKYENKSIATTKILSIVICHNLNATLKKNQKLKAQMVKLFGAVCKLYLGLSWILSKFIEKIAMSAPRFSYAIVQLFVPPPLTRRKTVNSYWNLVQTLPMIINFCFCEKVPKVPRHMDFLTSYWLPCFDILYSIRVDDIGPLMELVVTLYTHIFYNYKKRIKFTQRIFLAIKTQVTFFNLQNLLK